MSTSGIINIALAVAVVALAVALLLSRGKNETPSQTDKPASGEWQKITPAEMEENPFSIFRESMALSVGSAENMNSMTIGWGGLGILWRKPVVTVYVEQRRFTKHLMDENEYFTVTAFENEEQYRKALQYLGTASGRDEDKMVGSGLTVKFTDNGAPYFDEGRVVIECRKIYESEFSPAGFGDIPTQVYSNRPLHTEYVGEIVNVWVKN